MRAERAGPNTWMLVSASGQCQALKYLRKNGETAPQMLARIKDVDQNGPPANQELFKWLDSQRHRGLGLVIARIEDKTESNQKLNVTMKRVKAAIDEFLKDGEQYG